MWRKLSFGILSISGVILVASACSQEEPAYSKTPAIEYKSITKFTLAGSGARARRDSVVVSLIFKDGDDDLGEDSRDTARLRQIFTSQTWGNYQIRTFQFVNGRFEEVIIAANTKLFFGVGGNSGTPVEGMLDFGQAFPYSPNARLVPVKFQIRLRDRQLNESNLVETDTVRVPVL